MRKDEKMISEQTEKTYSIREISKMFDLPVSTLRYYEDEGILTKVGRTKGNQRVYYEMHINRLATICCFKRAGMTIGDLQKFFQYEETEDESIDDIVKLLEERKKSVEQQLNELEKRLYACTEKIAFLFGYRDALKRVKKNHGGRV